MKEVIKNTTLADKLLFFFLIAASITAILIVKETMPQGSEVIIEINGKPAYTFPVDINRTIPVSSPYGNSLIEIKDKKVRINKADCPNQLCVKQGWISKGVIVCLPGKILVIVGGSRNSPEEDIDAITG